MTHLSAALGFGFILITVTYTIWWCTLICARLKTYERTYVFASYSITFPSIITFTCKVTKIVCAFGVLVAIVMIVICFNWSAFIHIVAWFIGVENFEKSVETWAFVKSSIVHSGYQIMTARRFLKSDKSLGLKIKNICDQFEKKMIKNQDLGVQSVCQRGI